MQLSPVHINSNNSRVIKDFTLLSFEEKITLAGGCFWCIEGAYSQLIGVVSAVSGYMGGDAEHATYEDVCSGNTGHAEVVELTFENREINCREILEIFFTQEIFA